jgi:hypothetical protein
MSDVNYEELYYQALNVLALTNDRLKRYEDRIIKRSSDENCLVKFPAHIHPDVLAKALEEFPKSESAKQRESDFRGSGRKRNINYEASSRGAVASKAKKEKKRKKVYLVQGRLG